MRGIQNRSIWAKRFKPILYFCQTKTCIQTWIYRHKQAEQRLFPGCVVYLRLSCSSWALFIKLLKITNYPSFAVYRTFWKPQRMPLVLTLTEKTHVTKSKFSLFLSFPFSSYFQCSVWFGVFMSVSHYICQSGFISAYLSNQRQTHYVWTLALIDGRWSISIHIMKQHRPTQQWHDTQLSDS